MALALLLIQNPAFDTIIVPGKEKTKNELYLRKYVNGTGSAPNCPMNTFSWQNSEQNVCSKFSKILSSYILPYLQYCARKIIFYTLLHIIYNRICSHVF